MHFFKIFLAKSMYPSTRQTLRITIASNVITMPLKKIAMFSKRKYVYRVLMAQLSFKNVFYATENGISLNIHTLANQSSY